MMDLCDQEEMICSYVRSKEHDTKIETSKRYLAMENYRLKRLRLVSDFLLRKLKNCLVCN